MGRLLTSMAERAVGLRPAAMPLVRPVFAAPSQLEGRDGERPALIQLPRTTVAINERVTQPAPSLKKEDRGNNLGMKSPTLETRARRSPPPQETERQAAPVLVQEPPRNDGAPSRRPTLKEAIQQIYATREKPQEKPRVDPASLAAYATPKFPQPAKLVEPPLPARTIQKEDKLVMQDERHEHKVSTRTEPLSERVLPHRADAQKTAVVDDLLPGPARIRTDVESPTREVHVSIGRIEIKAAPQPGPPMPLRIPPPRRAHLSLNEYLERRRGGRP